HRRLAEIVGEGEERARHLALGADGPSAEVAQVLHEAARQAAARGAIGTAAELAEKAVRLTPVDHDDDLAVRRLQTASHQVRSLGTLCHYETYTGTITPGLIEHAVDVERSAPRPSNNYSPREILGLRLMYADRLDEARDLLEESLVAATELGDELDRHSLLVHL